jgi:MFS transporter, BCD family, chlorophyll transporter
MEDRTLGWFGIFRLGLVQAALGAVVVLTTSVLNRVMVVELALPAMVPGALVAIHFALQVLRPRLGYGSDVGGQRATWIIGGMAVLALGGFAAAVATAWMKTNIAGGIILAVGAFVLIGIGVGASGTTLLVLMAKSVAPTRRAAAATILWVMMISGFIVTTAVAGRLLDPYSGERLILISAVVSALAVFVTILAIWNVEPRGRDAGATSSPTAEHSTFRQALVEVWTEPRARRFAIFVFVSMLAYSAQDLILEPFAGTVFGFTPGETTKLSSLQHSGVLIGMLLVGGLSSVVGGAWLGSMRTWTVGGCIASAAALAALAAAGFTGPPWPLRETVLCLGVANGVYAVAAIGSMMGLAGAGHKHREGVRMGLWGAAQAIAFGLGGFAGTLASDVARALVASPGSAYALVFAGEAALFLASVGLAVSAAQPASGATDVAITDSAIVKDRAGGSHAYP